MYGILLSICCAYGFGVAMVTIDADPGYDGM